MTERPYTISLTKEELTLLQTRLRHWEHFLRESRPWMKEDEEDLSRLDREIKDCRNLKARLYRLRPATMDGR